MAEKHKLKPEDVIVDASRKFRKTVLSAYQKDPEFAGTVIAHEIGHLTDWLPHKTLARGGVARRLLSLRKHIKQSMDELHGPTPPLGFSPAEVTKELKDLTQWWNPFDVAANPKYTKYRHSAPELYAEALSVLMNNPQQLKERAPRFFDLFFEHLDRKPDVKRVYESLQDDIKSGRIHKNRRKALREGFRKGDDAWLKANIRKPRLADELKQAFWDQHQAIYDVIRKVEERNILPDLNPRYPIEKMLHSGSEHEAMFRDILHDVLTPIRALGLSWDDLGEYAFHQRVIGERTTIANPQGFTSKSSQEALDDMAKQFTPAQMTALKRSAADLQKIHQESMVSKPETVEMWSPELLKKMQDNKFYATFQVVNYIDKTFGAGTGRLIAPQVGTLKDIGNPVTALIMKDVQLITAANRNAAKKRTVEFYQEHDPEGVSKAQMRRVGKHSLPKPPKDKELDIMSFLDKGEMQHYYVDRFVASAFSKDIPLRGVSEVLRYSAEPYRKVFVEWNPGFGLSNLFRDFFSATANLPKANIPKMIKSYKRSLKPAVASAFKIPDPVLQEMLRGNMLLSVADMQGYTPEDAQLDKLLKQFYLHPKKWGDNVVTPVSNFLNFLVNINKAAERWSKIASYDHMKQTFPDMHPKELQHIVRNLGGSPNFMRKGKAAGLYNNLWLFSNPAKEGTRQAMEAFGRGKREYTWKKAKYILFPKMLMKAGKWGLLGGGVYKIMQGVSNYDAANYNIIPIGMTESGKSVYFRMPEDEFSRFVGGIYWKALSLDDKQQAANLFDYAAGQVPNLNPTFKIMGAVVDYASGKNPRDEFRGRDVVGETKFQARDWRSHKDFLKWIANNSGANIVYKFKTDDVDKIKSELETVLGYPLVDNILGRFIKVSDYGLREQLKEAKDFAKTVNAREILDAGEALRKIIDLEELTDEETTALLKKPEYVDRTITSMIARKHGSLYLEELLSASSLKEKLAVVEKIAEIESKFQETEPKEKE